MAVGSSLDLFLCVVPLVGAALSLVASTYMVLLLLRRSGPSRQKLLLRQLLHLSVANIVFSSVEVAGGLLELMVWSGHNGEFWSNGTWRYVCIGINTPGMFGAFASMLIECHLALAFTVSILRLSGTLATLSRWLDAIWLLALISAAGDVVAISDKFGYFWDAKQKHACAAQHGNIPDVVFMSVTVLFCVVCYLVGTCGVCMAGVSVQRRVWGRAQTYPLMAAITLVPTIVYNLIGPSLARHDNLTANYWCSAISTLSRNLSGVVYFAFYSLNTRYVRHSYKDGFHGVQNDVSPGDAKEHSFRVNFRGAASVLEIQGTLTPAGTPSSLCSDTPPPSVLSPHPIAEDEGSDLLVSYYMDSWTSLNSGAGRRWGVAEEQPGRPLVRSQSPLSSTTSLNSGGAGGRRGLAEDRPGRPLASPFCSSLRSDPPQPTGLQ